MKHVLVIADKHGGENSALKKALILQQTFGCELTVLAFCYADINALDDPELSQLSRRELEKKIIAHRKQQVSSLLNDFAVDPSNVHTKIEWSKYVAKAACAYCENHPVDLLIKSAHRSENWIYTSTDFQLMRECAAPVLITENRAWKKKPVVVAAIDFNTSVSRKQTLNHNLVSFAKQFSEANNAELHLACAIVLPDVLIDMDIVDEASFVEKKQRSMKPAIEGICQQYAIPLDNVHLLSGPPQKIIPRLASRQKADLVICGTLGRGGAVGTLIGNTAESILSRLHNDILVLKPSNAP